DALLVRPTALAWDADPPRPIADGVNERGASRDAVAVHAALRGRRVDEERASGDAAEEGSDGDDAKTEEPETMAQDALLDSEAAAEAERARTDADANRRRRGGGLVGPARAQREVDARADPDDGGGAEDVADERH